MEHLNLPETSPVCRSAIKRDRCWASSGYILGLALTRAPIIVSSENYLIRSCRPNIRTAATTHQFPQRPSSLTGRPLTRQEFLQPPVPRSTPRPAPCDPTGDIPVFVSNLPSSHLQPHMNQRSHHGELAPAGMHCDLSPRIAGFRLSEQRHVDTILCLNQF